MDRPLNSDRRDFSSDNRRDNNYYGHGGDDRRHSGGGYHNRRGRGRGGRGRGGRGGRFHHHHQQQPYRRGPPRRPGNRFQAEQAEQDPKQAAQRQLLQLLNKVGELQEPTSKEENTDTTTTANDSSDSQRPVVKAQAEKIAALTKFLCGPKAEMFLPSSNPVDWVTRVGPLVSGLVHCNAVWPLQTPCYAALTLSVHEHGAASTNIAAKCLEYAQQTLARDLDALLLEDRNIAAGTDTSLHVEQDRPRAAVRVRLTIRYLCLLASTGIVQAEPAEDTPPQDPVLAATNQHALTISGLLQALVQAAVQAASDRHQSNMYAAAVLTYCVLSNIPHVRSTLDKNWVQENLVEPLEEMMNESYQSVFAPGVGSRAILLKAERAEGSPEEENEDDDDDEEDEEEDASGQICDNLQDLMRSVKSSLQDDQELKPSKFALFTDAPWKELQAPVPKQDESAQDMTETEAPPPAAPLAYTGEPLMVQIFPTCKTLTMLLGGEAEGLSDKQLARRDLQGIVFGRLPIFGPPPEAADEDEEDDDMEDETPANPRLEAYRSHFGLVDRFFLSEAVRDCLLSHETLVTDAGVERGTCKGVAEQIWSLGLLLEDKTGIEYCILETLLSLVVQCNYQRSSPLRLVYLSRVLLELTRLDPATVSPAIALGVAALFEDYMPALVPIENLSRWLAFHLTNTDYQWPAAYWKHWEEYITEAQNSRGTFCKGVLSFMLENLSNPELLVTDCLPAESAMVGHLLPQVPEDTGNAEIVARIYEQGEDAATLLTYLNGDEVGEIVASSSDNWGRTAMLWKALLSPARKAHLALKDAIDNSQTDGGMEQDRDEATDVLSVLTDKLDQYKEAVLGVMAKDSTESSEAGELFLLDSLAAATTFSTSILDGCIHSCLLHKFVSVFSVVKWSLGERADGNDRNPVQRWWEVASAALEHGLVTEELPDATPKEDDGMAVEGESSPSFKTLAYLDPLLSYSVQRVGTLLQKAVSNEEKPNKLTPGQVDLIEGFKRVVMNCYELYYEMATGSTSAALQEALGESSVAGSSLASLLDTADGMGSDVLRQALEKM